MSADETTLVPQSLDVKTFASKVKAKYPDYADIDDNELTNKILTKYPDYEDSVSHLDQLNQFAQSNKLTIGSTTAGRHNTNSRHYSGNAVDIKGSGTFSDEQVADLSQRAQVAGLLVRDERTRPPKQKVWGGPHIHVEYPRQSKVNPLPVKTNGPMAAPLPSVATVQQPSAQQAEQSPLDRATTAIQQATPQDALQLAAQRHLAAVAQRQRQRQIQAKVAAARQAQAGPMGITSGAGGEQESIMPLIGGEPVLRTPHVAARKAVQRQQSQVDQIVKEESQRTVMPGDPSLDQRVTARLGTETAPQTTDPEKYDMLRRLGLPHNQIKALGVKADKGPQGLTVADYDKMPTPTWNIVPKSWEGAKETVGELYKGAREGAAGLDNFYAGIANIASLNNTIPFFSEVRDRWKQMAADSVSEVARERQEERFRRIIDGEETDPNVLAETLQGMGAAGPTILKYAGVAAITKGAGMPLSEPALFGTVSAIENSDKPAMDQIKELAKNVATGYAFKGLNAVGAKMTPLQQRAVTGAGMGAMQGTEAALSGQPIAPAVASGVGLGAGFPTGRESKPAEVTPREASIAPVIADARAERLRTNLEGAQPANISPEIQPDVAPVMRTERVRRTLEGAQPIDVVPGTAPAEPLRIERPDTEGAKLNRWQHRDFGLVTESADQSRVGKGRVRVLAEDGTEHIIQRPKGTGAGNQIAVPMRAKSIDTRAQDEAAQAAEKVPFKVVDRRGQSTEELSPPTIQPEPSVSPTQSVEAAQPASAETTASTPALLSDKDTLGVLGYSDAEIAKMSPSEQASIVQTARAERQRLIDEGQIKPSGVSVPEAKPALPPMKGGALTSSEPSFRQVVSDAVRAATGRVLRPVPKGFVRLYRGEPIEGAGRENIPDWLKTDPEYANIQEATGRWFSEDSRYARWYANHVANNDLTPRISYVDIPKDVAEQSRVTRQSEDVQQYSSDPDNEFFIPKEYADQRAELPSIRGMFKAALSPQVEPTRARRVSVPEVPQVKPPESLNPVKLQPEGQKERGHVATVEAKGFEVPDEARNYDPRTNVADVVTAQGIIDKEGPDAALERLRSGKHDIPSAALGHTLMVHLRGEAQAAEKAGDNETAAEKWAKTAEATGYTVSSLTPHAQEVQAASIINRLSPEGILTEATRIVKTNDPKATLTPELTKRFSDLGVERTDYDSLANKIEELQRATRKTGTRTSPSKSRTRITVTPSDILAKLEAGAKERLAAQGIRLSAGLDPEQFRDRSIIGAVKIAKGVRAISQWQAEMIKDFGEDIKPHLQEIRNEALRQFKDAKQEAKDQSNLKAAAKLAGMKPEEMTAEDLSKSQRYLDLIKAKKQIVNSELRHEMMKLEDDQRPKWQRQLAELNRAGMVGIRSFEKILGALTFKSAKDMIARFPEAAMDATRVFIKGGDTPRRATLPSPTGEVGLGTQTVKTAGRQVGNFVAAMRGKESAVMLAHESAFENPYVAGALTGSTRLLAGKEAILRTYHEESAKAEMANLLVKNDIADKQIEDNKDAIRDRLSMYRHESPTIDGPRNLKLIHDWANEVAKYEQRSGRIPAGGNKEKARTYVQARASELGQNVGTLLALKAQKQADFAVGAGPSRLQSALNTVERGARQIDTKFGGPPVAETSVKIARGVFLPFVVRPANSIGQHVADYLGLRAVPSLVGAINEKFDGPQTAVFQKTLSRGLTTHAFVAMAAMLAAKGLLDRDGNLHAGGKIYHTNEIPFLGWDMALGAGFHYGWQESKQKGKDPMIGAGKGALRATGNALAHHPLLRSAGDLADDFDDWRKSGAASEKVQRFAGQVGARFVPWPVQLAADVSDTKQREVKGPIAPVMNVVPGLRQELPVRMNKLTKTPVEKSRLHAFDPTRSEPEEENLAREKQRQKQEERMTLKEGILQRSNPHVSDEMKRLKTEGFSGEIKTPKDEIKVGKEKRQLTNDQWEGYTKDFQQEFYTKAEPIIASERYQKMDDDTKRKVLSRLRAVAHEIAKRNVIQTK